MNRSKVLVLGGLLTAALITPAMPALADKEHFEHHENNGKHKGWEKSTGKNSTSTTGVIIGIPIRASLIEILATIIAAIITKRRYTRTSKTCAARAKKSATAGPSYARTTPSSETIAWSFGVICATARAKVRF